VSFFFFGKVFRNIPVSITYLEVPTYPYSILFCHLGEMSLETEQRRKKAATGVTPPSISAQRSFVAGAAIVAAAAAAAVAAAGVTLVECTRRSGVARSQSLFLHTLIE